MNLDRFTQIVNAYGSRQARWPLEERQAAFDFLQNNEAAQLLLQQEKMLDDQLDQHVVESTNLHTLQTHILANIEQPSVTLVDLVIGWLVPERPQQFWRPVFAATLPLVIGTLMGISIDANIDDYQVDANDLWDDDIVLMFNVDTEEFIVE